MEPAFILLLGLILALTLSRVLKSRASRIESPKLGMVNLIGPSAQPLLDEDRETFAPLFGSPVEAAVGVPKCDVLLLYWDIGAEPEKHASILERIKSSGARVVLVASENEGDQYVAMKDRPEGVNFVMVLQRRGRSFPEFFTQLFSEMFKGTGMPVAWNKLAPQIPGREHPNVPDCICIMGAGQVAFK